MIEELLLEEEEELEDLILDEDDSVYFGQILGNPRSNQKLSQELNNIQNEINTKISLHNTSNQAHQDLRNAINNKVEKIEGKGLSTNDFTNQEKTKLAGLENYDDTDLSNRVSRSESDINSLEVNVLDLENSKAEESDLEALETRVEALDNDKIDDVKVNGTSVVTNKVANVDLTSYSLISETGKIIDLEINQSTYELVAKLYDKNNNLISTSSVIDLPIEQLVVNVSFDSTTNELVITLKNGTTVRVPLSAIISGLATETYVDNAIEELDETLSVVAKSGSYNDLLNKPTIPSVDGLASETWVLNNFLSNTLDVAIYDEEEISGTVQINADQLNGHADTYFAKQSDLIDKVDKIDGKGLSTNDYDNTEKSNVSQNTLARHTHSNKSILDTITQAMINLIGNLTYTVEE